MSEKNGGVKVQNLDIKSSHVMLHLGFIFHSVDTRLCANKRYNASLFNSSSGIKTASLWTCCWELILLPLLHFHIPANTIGQFAALHAVYSVINLKLI